MLGVPGPFHFQSGTKTILGGGKLGTLLSQLRGERPAKYGEAGFNSSSFKFSQRAGKEAGWAAPVGCIQVTVSNPFHVVILFQPVTLPCSYQVSAVPSAPIVLWKYKSFCRNRIADAFSPASADNQLNAQLAAGNPGYNPYVECQDSTRTVRVVATKQGNAVTLGEFYQGRRITITGDADLTFDQTAWGDSGVYYCSVVSAQDLQGNNEAYAELIVLGKTSGVAELLPDFQIGSMEDWLFVVVVVLAAFLVFLLLGICWCQCCPHTCCCYVRCPCCPDKCCCPEALYAAGKAATSGVPSIYAPSVYAPSTYAHLSPAKAPSPLPMIQMAPVHNGFAGDFDQQSSVGGHSSQVPLLHDTDSTRNSEVRSGYRIQANQQDDSMKVLYYMERELANFDPSRPGLPNGRVERAMSEVTSLHEDDRSFRPHRGPALTPIRDEDLDYRSQRSPGWEPGRERERPRDQSGGWGARRPRAHSVDALDDLGRPSSVESGRTSPSERSRGRAHAPPRSRSRDDLYSQSGDPYYDDYRSRGRPLFDARQDPHRSHSRSRDPEYDGRFLEDVLRKKEVGERRRPPREEEEEPYYPPAPPPYTETESQSSRERRLKKNLALSRESLVV
ncbi:lipolysis-stimulated lipoprotein receptor isoform X1 [Vombatus ursinus]|uniref:lipolysis-stimulated lipoprotein receptor isoform X1 n=1 Tax=Vombatus ursinus TaxID=29139 RepID=UPI000FFD3D08|nr:lipolysis-stimulated lipoprotein receptor isoform X1 [Vombatus ursinus]